MAQLEFLASLLSEDDSIYDSFLTDYALDEIKDELERSKFYANCNYIMFLTVENGRFRRSIVSKVFRKYYSDLQNQTKDNINYVLEVIKEEEKSKTTITEKELYRLMKVYYTFSDNPISIDLNNCQVQSKIV